MANELTIGVPLDDDLRAATQLGWPAVIGVQILRNQADIATRLAAVENLLSADKQDSGLAIEATAGVSIGVAPSHQAVKDAISKK